MNKEILSEAGIDYDDAANRFAGAVAVYERFLNEMTIINVLEPLQKALNEEDKEEAFKMAHNLKGNFGNLSIIPMYKAVSAVVEALKKDDFVEAKKQYITLEAAYNDAKNAVKKAQEN